jgi:hypothetical protein
MDLNFTEWFYEITSFLYVKGYKMQKWTKNDLDIFIFLYEDDSTPSEVASLLVGA